MLCAPECRRCRGFDDDVDEIAGLCNAHPDRFSGLGGVPLQDVDLAIRELEQAGVRAAFLNAINAAMERSKELARGEE